MPYPAMELNGQRLRGKLPAGDERYEKGLKLYTGMIGKRPTRTAILFKGRARVRRRRQSLVDISES
jgi:hypothetical protein